MPAVALIGAAVAMADTVHSTSKVDSGGTPTRPKPVAITRHFDIEGANGARAQPDKELNSNWDGLRVNTQYFPTCTAERIDAAQSDSVCPKGSKIATGKTVAVLGPVSAPKSMAQCKKNTSLYNAGHNRFTSYSYGPGSDCLGVGYSAPATGTFSRSGNSLKYVLPISENINQPLPGVTGYLAENDVKFFKLTTKVKGKTRGFFESVGCGKRKTRAYSFIVKQVSGGTLTSKSSAGKC